MVWFRNIDAQRLLLELAQIRAALDYLIRASRREEERDMSARTEIERIKAGVAGLTTVGASTKSLLEQLTQLVRDNAGDPVELRAIADALEAQVASITAAVVENTPSAGDPPPA